MTIGNSASSTPFEGNIGFWERLAKLGIHGVATLGLLTVYALMTYQGKDIPHNFWLLTVAMSAWLVGRELVKVITKT